MGGGLSTLGGYVVETRTRADKREYAKTRIPKAEGMRLGQVIRDVIGQFGFNVGGDRRWL
jgi:hypothetical protein